VEIGEKGRHDRRTGAPASSPSALHSGILTNEHGTDDEKESTPESQTKAMNPKTFRECCVSVAIAALGITACSTKAPGPGSPGRIDPASMRRIGTVDERFQSYNIEMVEVIGGRFWKPYRDIDVF
jgi:hypothetical protein